MKTRLNEGLFQSDLKRNHMRTIWGKVFVLFIAVAFAILLIVSFVVYPEIGEKILYGKHPPTKNLENGDTATSPDEIEATLTTDIENDQTKPTEYLRYSEIMASGNDMCVKYATEKSDGDINKFVDEFNDCNSQ